MDILKTQVQSWVRACPYTIVSDITRDEIVLIQSSPCWKKNQTETMKKHTVMENRKCAILTFDFFSGDQDAD